MFPTATSSLALFLIASSAIGQVPGVDTLRLDVGDAVARAVASSPQLARERLEVERARALRIGAAAFFPAPPELEYGRRTDLPFANDGEGGWELGLTQEVELGGQSALRTEAADLGVTAAELRVRVAELEVNADVRRSYARLAAAESRVRLFDTLLAFARRLDTAAGRLLAAEEISELERNAVRIERGRTEIERLDAVGSLEAARAELGVLVAAPRGTLVVTVAGSEDRIAAALTSLAAVEAALAADDTTIFVARPDWQALARARDRALVERRLASRAIVPSVRLGLAIEKETSVAGPEDFTVNGENASTGLSLRDEDMLLGFRLGVSVPLPIAGLYDVGQGGVAVADAEFAIAAAEQRVLAARIRADVARAAARLRPAAEALAMYRREIAPLVARNLELLERGYRAGEIGATELIPQQQQFSGAAEALIRAQLDFDEAYADFERALAR